MSPEAYNAVIGTYRTPIMGLGEVALVGAIVFHNFDGVRIVLIDFWSKGTNYQKVMFYVVIGLWVITMLGFVPRHLINVFSH